MYFLALSVGAVSVGAWSYLLLARGRYWLERIPTEVAVAPCRPERIAIIVPARNEADVIARSLTSLLTQTGFGDLHIFLVDDGSSDGTALVAAEAARKVENGARLTILPCPPPPAGWRGKVWALEQGSERARALAPDFFLFTDADIVHAPGNVARLAEIARAGAYDLASFMVELHCASVAEKLLIPPFVYFFFQLYPPAWIADPRRSTAGAAGGCMLLRAAYLERMGGLHPVRDAIIDDCTLAAAVKRSGGRVWLGLTHSAVSIRPYESFAHIGSMISRTAFSQLRHSALLLLLALAALSVTYVAPLALLFSPYAAPRVLGGAAYALMTLSFLAMVRTYRLNPLWALTLPLAAVFYMGATLHSAWKFWRGRGGEWKGRVQDPARSQV